MKERLQEILSHERLTPTRFAELVGVQRSSVSHILAGRNKPSLDFLQKTLAAFEHISPDWLISGKGEYKRQKADRNVSVNREFSPGRIDFSATEQQTTEAENKTSRHPLQKDESAKIDDKSINTEDSEFMQEEKTSNQETPKEETEQKEKKINKRKIVKTMLFYDDQTFELFYPNE